jgi:hypothetical protein
MGVPVFDGVMLEETEDVGDGGMNVGSADGLDVPEEDGVAPVEVEADGVPVGVMEAEGEEEGSRLGDADGRRACT